MTTKDVLALALQALEEHDGNYAQSNASATRVIAAITAIKQVQQAQEPADAKRIAECLAVLRPKVKRLWPHEQALEELARYAAHPAPKQAEPAIKESLTVPEGYKLVPVEPTREMLYAIQNDCDIMPQRGKRIWATLLAVAPTPPEAA